MLESDHVKGNAHPACLKPFNLWSAPDSMATEDDVTAFIAALVRMVKPAVIVETGTYLGYTTRALADAVKANGVGSVTSFEIDPRRVNMAKEALQEHLELGNVNIVGGRVTPENCPANIELAFLDSADDARQLDMNVIWPRVLGGGMVLVHDASPRRLPGRVRPQGPFVMLDIATPRGLNIFQKPRE